MDSENQCYICYDVESAENPYAISPCNCKGSIHLHKTCLETLWKRVQNCGICMESWNKPKKYRDGLELIEIFDDDLFMIVQYTIDSSGNKHGLYQKWYKCGQIYIECTYDMDYRSGVYREWYSNGQIKTKSYYKNNSSDTENTPHWSYMKGLRHGISQTWYENGQLQMETTYVNHDKNGSRKIWYEDGQIKSQENYVNNHCDGEILTWYENGQLASQKFYKMGDRVGKHTEWYINGNLKSVYSYDENRTLLEGEYSKWYENGQPQEIGEYKHSGYDGEITVWYKNGIIQSKKTYQNTICILRQSWYPSGQLCEYEDIVGEVRKYRKDGTLWFSGQYNKKAKKIGIWDITIYKKNNILEKENYFNPYNINYSSYEIDEKYPYKYHKIIHYSENGDVIKDLVWINDDLRKRYVKKDGDEKTWIKEMADSDPVLEHIMTTKYKGTEITKKFQNGKLIDYSEV